MSPSVVCLVQASAVIQMLEQRAGEDNFKRLLSRLVGVSCQPASPQGAPLCYLHHFVMDCRMLYTTPGSLQTFAADLKCAHLEILPLKLKV